MAKNVVPVVLESVKNIAKSPFRKERRDISTRYHFVFTHPDDELAILKQLGISNRNSLNMPSITLVTNGSQGYEPLDHSQLSSQEIMEGRHSFGELRTQEFNESLRRVGIGGEIPSRGR